MELNTINRWHTGVSYILTSKDLAAYSSKRRVDARASNPRSIPPIELNIYIGTFLTQLNSSTLLTIFGLLESWMEVRVMNRMDD